MKAFRKIGLLTLFILLLTITFVISGCNNFSLSFSLSKELDGEYLGPLGISPDYAVVTVGKKITVSVSGGLKPYKYSSEKGTIDENGVYSAPSLSTADLITVEDAYGDAVLSIVQIIEDLQVSPVSDVLNSNETSTFFISGGLPPYTVTVNPSNGTIQLLNGNEIDFQAPGVSSNETDTITITDSLNNTATVTVLVTTIGGGLYIDPPAYTINVGDIIGLTANGGITPYISFQKITGPGTLNWTSPSSNATFTATAAGIATVEVTDSTPDTAQSVITVKSLNPLDLQPAAATVVIGDTIQFTASGGVPGYTFKVISGAGTIDSRTGLYTAVKQGNDRVQVTDAEGTTVTVNVSVKKK